MNKVSTSEKLALFHGHWHPRIVGELNGQHVKLVKFQGEFVRGGVPLAQARRRGRNVLRVAGPVPDGVPR